MTRAPKGYPSRRFPRHELPLGEAVGPTLEPESEVGTIFQRVVCVSRFSMTAIIDLGGRHREVAVDRAQYPPRCIRLALSLAKMLQEEERARDAALAKARQQIER